MESVSTPSDLEDIEKAFSALQLYPANTAQTSNAIAVLAEASRSNLEARAKLSDAQSLKTLIEIVECSINDDVEIVESALRCIGNACIDNEAAREVITGLGFSWALQCFNSGSASDYTTPILTSKVLYNICMDYEPAQKQCFKEQVHYELIQIMIATGPTQTGTETLLTELLHWICDCKQYDQDLLPAHLLLQLLELPIHYADTLEVLDFAYLTDAVLNHVRDTEAQRIIMERKRVVDVWWLLETCEARISCLEERDEDFKLLQPISMRLISCLSDIATVPEFATAYPLTSELITDVVLQVINTGYRNGTPASSRLIAAAYQVLCNLLWAQQELLGYEHLASSEQLHIRCISQIKGNQDDEVVHAAAFLLIQLSRLSPAVRDVIGECEGVSAALEKLCRHETPRLKQDGILLLRALGRECPANQERFEALAKEVMESASSSAMAIDDEPHAANANGS